MISTPIVGCLETSTRRGSSGHLCCQKGLLFVFTEGHHLCLGVLGYPMNQWFGLILNHPMMHPKASAHTCIGESCRCRVFVSFSFILFPPFYYFSQSRSNRSRVYTLSDTSSKLLSYRFARITSLIALNLSKLFTTSLPKKVSPSDNVGS